MTYQIIAVVLGVVGLLGANYAAFVGQRHVGGHRVTRGKLSTYQQSGQILRPAVPAADHTNTMVVERPKWVEEAMIDPWIFVGKS